MEKIDLSFLKTDIDKRILQIVRKSNRIFELNLKKDLERRMEMTKINNKKSVTNLIVAVSAVALITMMSLILFAGCGGTNPVGTWTLDRVVVDGTTYRADD